jgi:hypothetical protein
MRLGARFTPAMAARTVTHSEDSSTPKYLRPNGAGAGQNCAWAIRRLLA